MHLHIVDTEAIYRQLLVTVDAAEREEHYRAALLAPFEGMFRAMGGGDALMLAKTWTLYTPEDFASSARGRIEEMLDRLAAHAAWARTAEAAERGLAAFAPHAARIPLDNVFVALVLTDHARGNPLDRGYSGFGGIPGYVLTSYSDPNDYTLPRVGAATVHELNHNVRFAVFPFNPMTVSLGEYIIAEGLAETFAVEQFGEEVAGYFVTDITPDDLGTSREIIGSMLDATGFDVVRGYVFGDAIAEAMGRSGRGVPNFAGYATGYRVVQRYLERTGKTAVEATFVPAREIIAESGYFDER